MVRVEDWHNHRGGSSLIAVKLSVVVLVVSAVELEGAVVVGVVLEVDSCTLSCTAAEEVVDCDRL